jgi:hypothetical protein
MGFTRLAMTPMPLRSPYTCWLELCLFSSSVHAASTDGVLSVSHPAAAGACMLAQADYPSL